MKKEKNEFDTVPSTSSTTPTISPSDYVTTITLPGGLPQPRTYDPSTPSNEIIEDSTAASNIELEPFYREEITETLERSRGLIDGGVKISIKLPDALSGAQFEFEKKPREEKRKITRKFFNRKNEC